MKIKLNDLKNLVYNSQDFFINIFFIFLKIRIGICIPIIRT